MGNRVDFRTPGSLDRRAQQLTRAELDRLEELLTAMTDDDEH
ncbi:hypothetical protein [Nonomuraea sp. NPDC049400]